MRLPQVMLAAGGDIKQFGELHNRQFARNSLPRAVRGAAINFESSIQWRKYHSHLLRDTLR
jgi:hypothetical protein